MKICDNCGGQASYPLYFTWKGIVHLVCSVVCKVKLEKDLRRSIES